MSKEREQLLIRFLEGIRNQLDHIAQSLDILVAVAQKEHPDAFRRPPESPRR